MEVSSWQSPIPDSVHSGCTIQPPIPEVRVDPSSALGAGYPESKWVAEQVLYNVAERAGVPVGVVRLGQISGDKTGHWNEREWAPALVKSASLTSTLPIVEGVSGTGLLSGSHIDITM